MAAWLDKQTNFKKIRTFGCLVQYPKVGHDKDKKRDEFATRTAYDIVLGMPKHQAGYLIWDLTKMEVLVEDDIKFYDDDPIYSRLQLDRKNPEAPGDIEYFPLFPMEEEAAATPSATPT